MVLNDAAHVRHATVANFHVVLVEDGVEIVVWWEVFLDWVEEGFGDVSLNILFFFFLTNNNFICNDPILTIPTIQIRVLHYLGYLQH